MNVDWFREFATVAQSVVRPRPGRPAVEGIQSEVAWTGEAGAQGDGVKSFIFSERLHA